MLVMSLVPVMLYVLFWRAGETLPLRKIAAEQFESDGLYGTAVHDDTAEYKLALYEAQKPDVVAIGSSRVMQFRGEAFSASFVNLGGTVKGLSHAVEVLPYLFSVHRPKLILFGVDFWWFNDVRPLRSSWLNQPLSRGISIQNLPLPLEWLADGKLTFKDVGHILKRMDRNHFGVQAILRRDGFDRYGSYHYTSTITGAKSHFDARFSNILGRVRRGDNRFEWGNTVAPERWNLLLEVLEAADRASVPVVLLLPPVAPRVADEMEAKGTYGLVDELKIKLTGLGRPFFDFHDTRRLGAGDCAFIDGDHGGDILYARMAALMEQGTPQLNLDWINEEIVGEIVLSNPGAATARQWRYSEKPEVDYLEIGCR
jgi:hypothetical protein